MTSPTDLEVLFKKCEKQRSCGGFVRGISSWLLLTMVDLHAVSTKFQDQSVESGRLGGRGGGIYR